MKLLTNIKQPNSFDPEKANWIRFCARVTHALSLLVLFPIVAMAQDPLGPGFQPVIDTNSAHYPSNIWVTDTMTKVRQDSGSPGAAHWGVFYGTQGEFVDFQVHVQAPASGYSALTISASSFVQSAPSSFTIPAPSTTSNNVVVYREGYIPVTTVSATAAVYYNATGKYPDPLIPAIDPYFHQVTNAFPVAVAASQNQSAWIDVFVPQNAPSGFYLGSITVSNSGTTVATLPIVIAVWQWPISNGGHMPGTSSLPSKSGYGFADFCNAVYGNVFNACGAYPPAGGNAGLANCLTDIDGVVLFLDHRWSVNDPIQCTTAQTQPVWVGNTSSFPSAKTIIPGAALTTQNDRGQFTLPSSGNPPQDFATFFGSIKYPSGSTGSRPLVTPFWYTADEPGMSTSAWTTLCNSAIAAHGTTPPVATAITSYIAAMNANANTSGCSTQGVMNSVDVMIAPINLFDNNDGSGLQLPNYSAWLSHSNPDGIKPSLWSYLSCSSAGTCGNGSVGGSTFNYPNYNVDSKPAGNRVMEWLTYFHGQTGELYYYTTCEWESGCAALKDPWTGVYQFGNNGDGTLLYPSAWCNSTGGGCTGPTQHVTQQSGSPLITPLWIASVRMKHMRDGMQDYEYMNALNRVGQGTFVTTQITSWITNSYTYEFSGSGLMTARQALGNKVHQLTYNSSGLLPVKLSGTLQ